MACYRMQCVCVCVCVCAHVCMCVCVCVCVCDRLTSVVALPMLSLIYNTFVYVHMYIPVGSKSRRLLVVGVQHIPCHAGRIMNSTSALVVHLQSGMFTACHCAYLQQPLCIHLAATVHTSSQPLYVQSSTVRAASHPLGVQPAFH